MKAIKNADLDHDQIIFVTKLGQRESPDNQGQTVLIDGQNKSMSQKLEQTSYLSPEVIWQWTEP